MSLEYTLLNSAGYSENFDFYVTLSNDGAANSIDALNNQYFFLISSYLHKEAQGDLNASNHENWTPLHVAVKENQEKALEYLLENKAETSPGSFSTTPLHLGTSINYVVKILGIFDPPPPSWSLLLIKAYVIKWSFG